MANYYLNDNGSISKKKQPIKQASKETGKGTNYIINQAGAIVPEKITTSKTNVNKKTLPVSSDDYNTYTTKKLRQEREKLLNQINDYSGTNSLKGFFEAMSGQTEKRLKKDKKYQNALKRLNEMETILEDRFNTSKEGQTLPMQFATTTEQLVKNPLKTAATMGVGITQGADKAIQSAENSLLDLGKFITGNNKLYNNYYQKQKIEQINRSLYNPIKKTETYQKIHAGDMDTGQQVAYNFSTNIGNTLPAAAVSLATGSPTLGSAMFYAQAQDSYYNEALERGYNEKQARMYSLGMAGIETIVERLGFDELGGLGKLSEKSIIKAVVGEGLEEAVTPYIDAVFRKFGFNENVDWSDTKKEAISGALMGALTGGFMNLVGKGFVNVDSLVNKINSNEEITSKDIKKAFNEVQEADPNFMDNILSEASENIDENTINEVENKLKLKKPLKTKVLEKIEENRIKEAGDRQIKEKSPIEKQETSKKEIKPQNIKETVNYVNDEIGLSKSEQRDLTEKLKPYESMSKEQLTNKKTQDEIKNIISEYKTRSVSYDNTDVRDIKKYIRNTNIKISDNLKNQITDYNDFRKSNFGNLKLTKEGTPIDVFWEELKETYPQFANEEVNGETDILEKLADFVKQDNVMTENYTIPDDEIDKLSTQVFNSLIRNAESETEMPTYEISNDYDNVNIPLAKNYKDIVLKITEDSTPRQKENTIKMLSEPQKNKVTVIAEDGTKFINPSQNRNASMEEITKMVNDTESESEQKQIEVENKKRRKSREQKLKQYKSEGNIEMIEYTQYQLDNDLYEERHTNYEQDLLEQKMTEDPEDFYKKFYQDYQDSKINNKLTAEKRLELQDKATVLQKYYGNMKLKTYNGEIAKIIDDAFFELGTPVGQLMQGRKNYYENLNRMGAEVLKEKRAMFNEEAKEHLDDPAWLKKNDPINPKSKYYTNVKDYSAINNLGKELFEIGKEKGITSDEYIEKATQLDKAIKNAYKGNSLTGKLKSLTITNVLASTRIWVQNHKGNFINLGQYEILDNIPATVADKIMSTQTDMRTRGISFRGDVLEGGKGFFEGYKNTFYEFKNDLSLSNKFSRESSVEIGKKNSIGHTFSNNNLVGKLLNRYERFVNFAIESGDRPYAMYYFEKSCYNQRMLNAQIQAKKQNTNMIYKEIKNSDTGMYAVSYYDSEGKVHSGEFMNESEYKNFKETAKVQDLTEDMVNIAEQEALENTFQNDNRLTKAAVGLKKNLNNIFSIGDYGLGDVFLKFTRTGSNMARALYEHSPMEAITLTKDLIRYNANLKNIDSKTGKNSVTPQMQHKVATDFGKLVGGALVYVPVAIMTWGGKGGISRKDDDDKQTKFKNITLGSKEYSIKLPFGDYTYKLSNDSTLESLIRQGVDISDLFNQTGSVIDTFLGSANSFTNSMIDMSFMSNVLDMSSSYSDPLDNIKKKFASQPANMIPSLVKDISYTVDGFTKRNTYDKNIFQYGMNQIIDRTPLRKNGLKIGNVKIEGLTPQRNSWGEVRKVGADLLSSVWNTWLSSDTLSKISDDPISKETIDVYMSTHDTDAMPKLKLSKNSFSYNDEEIKLNKQQEDDYMRVYGKTAYNSIKKLMKTSQYKNATDDYKLKLLKQAYSYADEKAQENRLKSTDMLFLNYKKKDNKFTEYRKPVFEEIIENDISIDEAQYKRKNPNPYKLHTSITNWENYQVISKDIKNIGEMYSKENGFDNKTKRYAIQTYISKLNGLTAVQKAMLSKLENNKGDYTSYDNQILSYLKSLNLTNSEYKYMYDKLGLGGYYIPIYKSKKNK